jgi:hypothetical protein
MIRSWKNFVQNFAAIGLIVLVPVVTGCSKGYEVSKISGEYTVSMSMGKNPFVGDNPVTIQVKDASGKYITDATISIENSMPAMPGMPAMSYKTDATLQGTQYKATLNLSMSGAWNVAVKINRSDKPTTVTFNVDVS